MAWSAPTQLPNLSAADALVWDFETRDEGLAADVGPAWPWKGGEIVGVGVGTVDHPREWYFPIRHKGGGNVNPDAVLAWARDTAKARPRKHVFFNALYDLGWGRTEGIEFVGEIHDAMAGAGVLDEQRASYSLDSVAAELGIAGKNVAALVEAYKRLPGAEPIEGDWVKAARANLWRLHGSEAGEYGEGDISVTRGVWLAQAPLLANENLGDLYRLECDILPLLTEMRARGVRIDLGAAERLWDEFRAREQKAMRQLKIEFGARVTGARQNAQLGEVCDRLGIAYPRTKSRIHPRTGRENGLKPSFSKEWTANHPHPFFRLFNHWRELNTIRTLCIEGVLKHAHGDRVYPEFSPLKRDDKGTVSGRFACANPNAQQASERSELGRQVRALYLPEEGELWHAADVSQQEPRLMVHYGVRFRMTGALEAARAFEKDGADWHQIVADMVGITRKTAKPINLGLGYGMGEKKLAKSLGLSLEEARVVLAKYHERLPFVRSLMETCENAAAARGYITTLLGRRRRFPYWEADVYRRNRTEAPKTFRGTREQAIEHFGGLPVKRAFVRKALNALIQGSAADWIKAAMRDLWREGFVPMLQVHDELDTSVSSPEVGKRISEIVKNAVSLRCPILVDSGLGPNWRDAKG